MQQLIVGSALRRTPLAAVLVVCVFSTTAPAQSLPQPWHAGDVGVPALGGTAVFASGTFQVDAAGAGLNASRDEFHFVYQRVEGEVDIRARIDGPSTAHPWSKAGVMIRGSLEPSAAYGAALVTAQQGLQAAWRLAAGQSASSTAAGKTAAPVWLRVVRTGAEVTAYWSADGASWSVMGSRTVTQGMAVYVGLVTTSQIRIARTSAAFSDVRLTGTHLGSLPAGQTSADVGAPAIPGRTIHANGAYAVSAGGRGIGDVRDEFHFVYQPLSGSGMITARVAALGQAATASSAGVMIRESLAADSRHAYAALTAGSGYVFTRRPEAGGHTDQTSGGDGAAPGWVRLARSGDLIEAYRSADGSTWTRFGIDSLAMRETVWVGLAVSSALATSSVEALFDQVSIKISVPPAPNLPPLVSITSPVSGAQFTVPATVTLTAAALDPENRLAEVEFYAGTELIARDTASPYEAMMTVSTAGAYTFTALAADAEGNSTISDPVVLTFLAPPAAVPRAVSFTASSDHATNVTSYVLDVFASGVNPSTAPPVASSDLGKPTPATDGTITVDRSAFFSALAPGSYLATVSAVGPGGRTRGAAVSFVR
jgi:regulation of enolase protein 1 (concanavalin A-like superfamily)